MPTYFLCQHMNPTGWLLVCNSVPHGVSKHRSVYMSYCPDGFGNVCLKPSMIMMHFASRVCYDKLHAALYFGP